MINLLESNVANQDLVDMAAALMDSRHTILPKRLIEPGPDDAQLVRLFSAAATAPDHGRLCPWRFIVVPTSERHRLAETFAASLRERDENASEEEMNRAREKAYRAPLLLLMVVDTTCGDSAIDFTERLISAGCALQNMLLMATAMGFGSALTSGKALKSIGLHALFQLSSDELALCFISIGTVLSRKSAAPRPQINTFVSMLPPIVKNKTETCARGVMTLTGLETK
jgi:nitroreductase